MKSALAKFCGAACAVIASMHVAWAGTVAQWSFDGPKNLYPSLALTDMSGNDYFLIMGRGAHLVDGRFGTALLIDEPRPLTMTGDNVTHPTHQGVLFGIVQAPTPAGRTLAPMTWQTANFAGLLTAGENHLRKPDFPNPSETKLNIGNSDWTVEFWFQPVRSGEGGVVLQLGSGPRGEKEDIVTRLSVQQARGGFELLNQAGKTDLFIPSAAAALRPGGGWHHYAFVYDARADQVRHYVDGKLQKLPAKAKLAAVPHGDEAYLSIGRDGLWQHPLPGALDEMRISDDQVYRASFKPASFMPATVTPAVQVKTPLPLLFPSGATPAAVTPLGSRKFLFLDDALVAEKHGVSLVPNPPKRMEKVIDRIRGHMSVVEDASGLLRLYYDGPKDSLAVMTSRDGIHWEKPDLPHGDYMGAKNVVLREKVGLGNVFLDPTAAPDKRWVYFSGVRKEAFFVFTSADGFDFKRDPVAALPFAGGSQSVVYYDDQRQLFVGHHRSDYGETEGGATSRRYVRSESANLHGAWDYSAQWQNTTGFAADGTKVQSDKLDPWFLDNGPLTPSGIGAEMPTVIGHEPQDPIGTDVYVTKVVKYPWAPDAYLAFPSVYFHYWEDGPPTRQMLGMREEKRGSGVTEVQLEVSRDGVVWHRSPRPAYAALGELGRNDTHMLFMVQGLIKRGDEIWQYVGGHPGGGMGYHSPWEKNAPSPLYRLVQRVDGFMAEQGDYSGGELKTRTLTFTGDHLELNVDTGAVGWVQAGLLDGSGKPIPGYGLDDCVYINGDYGNTTVRWIDKGTNIAALQGKPVQLVFRLHGARLYAMQFTGGVN